MTLIEVLIATGIFALVFGSVITGMKLASYRATWATLSIEAGKLAEQRMERMQTARWDLSTSPVTDELISNNFLIVTNDVLWTYTNGPAVLATNWVTINSLPNTASPQYKVLVSSVKWNYLSKGPFTNTVTTIRGPDQ
jgi:type II secretory pathway pseudopilin PulG